MSGRVSWAKAIGFLADQIGGPQLETVVTHIRDAVNEEGVVSRGKITSGLAEAYRPLDLDESLIHKRIEDALNLLLQSGDIDEYRTGIGRCYASTPPRLVDWGGKLRAILGSCSFGTGLIRRAEVDAERMESTIQIALSEELGRAEWRNALVELGGGDDPSGDARSLCVYSENLASSGESFSLDDPTTIAVLGGRGEFFGSAEPILSGRWRRIDSAGFFPGIYRVGYSPKYVMVSVSGSGINVWEPPSRDIWRWLVVGYTLKLGDPVLRYCAESGTLDFLVPPPFQAERAALIAGTQVGTWSWQVEPSVYELIKNLTGFP